MKLLKKSHSFQETSQCGAAHGSPMRSVKLAVNIRYIQELKGE
jgi:hypothetical protein